MSNTQGERRKAKGESRNGGRLALTGWLGKLIRLSPFAFILLAGCADKKFHLLPGPKAPPAPADSLILRGDKLEEEKPPAEGSPHADLAGAHELYRNGEYDKAEKFFRRIANNTKNAPPIAEEARYYEAECYRRQERYPKAADTYHKLLLDFPSGQYREPAIQRMFYIANYWLDLTREEMRLHKEKDEGKRWVVWPAVFHFEKSVPLLDPEGRAIEKLEQVRVNDMTGPLADRALFLCGSVKFFREDYREADVYFSQLVEMHPNSALAPQAVELAIISKHLSTGGSDYDGRKVAEARHLVDAAFRNYPELATQKKDFLERQLYCINFQQAEKDYKIAEFYRRTGHAPSAYFYYEIVRRRYPGTKFFDLATERMHQIHAQLEAEAEKEKDPSKRSAGEKFVALARDWANQPKEWMNQLRGKIEGKPEGAKKPDGPDQEADEAPNGPQPAPLPELAPLPRSLPADPVR